MIDYEWVNHVGGKGFGLFWFEHICKRLDLSESGIQLGKSEIIDDGADPGLFGRVTTVIMSKSNMNIIRKRIDVLNTRSCTPLFKNHEYTPEVFVVQYRLGRDDGCAFGLRFRDCRGKVIEDFAIPRTGHEAEALFDYVERVIGKLPERGQ